MRIFFVLEIEATDIPIIAEDIEKLEVGFDKSSLLIPLRNLGPTDTTYEIFVEGEPWLSIEEDEVTIEGKSIGTITLISSPLESTEADDYDMTLVLRVKSTGVEYAKKFTISLVGPTMFEGLVEEYGALAYGGLGALIFLLILAFALVLYMRATKDERAERREERAKEKDLKRLEKEKIREQRQLERDQAAQEKQRTREEVAAAKISAKEAKIKEREDIRLTREKEREERILGKETSFLERKRLILLKSLYSSLGSEYLYINKETLLPEGRSSLKVLFSILFVVAAGVLGYLFWSTLVPYIWYVVGGVLIVVLAVIVLNLYLRLRVQKLQDHFEERQEYKTVHAQAIMDLKERYYLLTKASVNALKTTIKVLASFMFFLFFAVMLAVVTLFRESLGNFALYAMIGFALLTFAFLLLFLVKFGMRKKSVRLFRLSELVAGKSYPLTVSTQDGFGEILLRVKKGINCVYFAVHNLYHLNVFVSPTNPVYRAFELKAAGMTDRDMDKSIIRFSVRKRWLKRNMIDKDKVRLERYANNRWVGITDVKIISEDDKSVTYETVHSGLGLLVITGKQGTLKLAVEPKKKAKIVATGFKPKKKDKTEFPWLNAFLGAFFILIFLTIAGIFLYAWIDSTTVKSFESPPSMIMVLVGVTRMSAHSTPSTLRV